MPSNDDTNDKEVDSATCTTPSLLHSAPSSRATSDDDGVDLTEKPTQSEVLQKSSRPLLSLHLRPPPTGVSSSCSSLDSCLAAFPLQPGMPSQDSTAQIVHRPPPIVTCAPLHASPTSTSNANSPLMSALVDMSECSTLNESAVASSDDAMCSSPLLAEIKDRRFSTKREPVLKDDLHSHPSLSYIRALGHWQEQAFPPVPAIPAQFQEPLKQSTGWIKCAQIDGSTSDYASEAAGEIVKNSTVSSPLSKKDLHRQSMTSSSRITVDPIYTASEYSLDTCSTSINTPTSAMRSSKRDSIGNGLLKYNGAAEKRRGPSIVAGRESKTPFAFNVEVNDSTSSLVSRSTSRPDTASKRIAFAPSVRIGTSTPSSREAITRKGNHTKNVGSLLSEMRMNAADRSVTPTPPPPPPPKEDNRFLTARTEKAFLSRPSTAPHPNRRAAAEITFRKLLRPISRQNREGGAEDGQTFFSRPRTAKSKKDDSDTASLESRQSIHAPLHLDGPFGRSQPSCMARPLEATRLEELPSPPRAFYPGTLILVKDQEEEEPPLLRSYKSRIELSELDRDKQERDGCPSYVDAVAGDARHDGTKMSSGHDNVVWRGEPMQVKSDKRGGLKKLKKAVFKVTEAFTAKVSVAEKVPGQVENGDRKRQSRLTGDGPVLLKPKSISRPSTAPSLANAPRWGSSSLNKVARIVARYESAAQPSILVGQTREMDKVEALRNQEELRKRNTPWDSQPSIATPQNGLCPPHYPRSQRRESNQNCRSRLQQEHSEPASSASPSLPSLQHPYRIALLPVARVSPDQLKRMQPVKIVKYPIVDTPAR